MFPTFDVRDVEAAATFYERVFGFVCAFRWPVDGRPEYMYLRRGDQGIGLVHEVAGSSSLCVRVDNLEAAEAQLRALGAIELDAAPEPWGERMAAYESADGHRILLIARR